MQIDITILRSSVYDSQAKWGVSTRYHWFKGYKLHLCTTAEGIILSHMLTTANRNDAAVAPELLVSLNQWDIYWGMPRMTAKRFVKQQSSQESYSFPPSTAAIARNEKMPMAVLFLFF
ncbi:transposase [Geobacillus stearothermophilus]|nr:transposase [Geobacillus stearothermophilus]